MLGAQDDVSERVQDHALATMECDVPVGWSLDEWRTVRQSSSDQPTGTSHSTVATAWLCTCSVTASC